MNNTEHSTDHTSAPALSRRRFMAIATASTAATLPAVALADASGKTSRLPQPPELPMVKARRLARELSSTMSEFENGRWYVTVYPGQDWCQFPVRFGCIKSDWEARYRVDQGLIDVVKAHQVAKAAFDAATCFSDRTKLGREPTNAERRIYRKAANRAKAALCAVLSYVTHNSPSDAYKAKYILKYSRLSPLDEHQHQRLLKSMLRRGYAA